MTSEPLREAINGLAQVQTDRRDAYGEASGGTKTKEYRAWTAMRHRCAIDNPRHRFHFGRGITVCERWNGRSGFRNFLADMGRAPTPLHSLDRIDNDGNYNPSNCRWATAKEQQRNTSRTSNAAVTRDLSEATDLPRATIRSRLQRGWPMHIAIQKLTLPEARRLMREYRSHD